MHCTVDLQTDSGLESYLEEGDELLMSEIVSLLFMKIIETDYKLEHSQRLIVLRRLCFCTMMQ